VSADGDQSSRTPERAVQTYVEQGSGEAVKQAPDLPDTAGQRLWAEYGCAVDGPTAGLR
jgi:hypothetical protein